jgi:hypothetical protein
LKRKIRILDIILFVVPIVSILLYLAGTFSSTGLIPLHYTVSNAIFWGSILVFFIGAFNISGRIGKHASVTNGFDGTISRTIRRKGESREYFFSGLTSDSVRGALKKDWPFEDQSPESDWQVVDASGAKIDRKPLESIEGVVQIIFTSMD